MNLKITISLFLLAAIACLSEGCCTERFMQVGNWCYHYNSDRKDWHDARDECIKLGAHLVSIHSLKDSEDVYALWKSFVDESYADDKDEAYWIGLYDVQTENSFQWSDGTAMDFSLWQPGEPNNHKGEDCVAPRNDGSNDHERQKWNDGNCRDKKSYFCRRSAIPLNHYSNQISCPGKRNPISATDLPSS